MEEALAPTLSETARPPRLAVVWLTALAGCAAGVYTFELAYTTEGLAGPGVRAALSVWMFLPYVLAGLVAWWRRPESRFGPLMTFAGLATFLVMLTWSRAALPFTVGVSLDLLPPILFLHVFLAFPTGRLHGRFERRLVGVGYAVALGPAIVRMTLGGSGPDNLLEVVSKPGASDAILRAQLGINGALALVGVGVLVARRLREGPPLRRSLTLLVDSFALALVMLAALAWTAAFGGPELETVRRLTFAVIGAAPIAFLVGLLHARLARAAAGDLLVVLRADAGPADVRDAIAYALRDPSLTLAYWLPEFDTYADVEGRPVELPEPSAPRATTRIDRDGAHVAVLVHDPALEEEPRLLEAVTAAAGIALENARLHELHARLEELHGSRARIVEAGRNERKRLERNLHDGAQQRLIALSLELNLLEERLADDADASARIGRARREVAASLEELREVARGLHPAVVSGHGLAVALEQLAAHAAVPVRLKVVEVADDGVGGADENRGTGLRGLADRVEVLGGTLRVWSPAGGGTRVRAEIPCAR